MALPAASARDFTPGGLVAVDAVRRIAHTSNNAEIEYDQLLIACGALPTPAIPGALTFRGPADVEKIAHLLEEIEGGGVRSVAFAIPWGAVWSLPAYELALLTTAHLERRGVPAIELTVVTPEEEPLQVFGSRASEAVRGLLAERGVTLRLGAYSKEVADGALRLIPQGWVAADRIVALPRLQGAHIDGIPQTVHGFVPVDAHCSVHGVADVYAAGDITSFTDQTGRHRDSAGGRGRTGHRGGRWGRRGAGAVPPRAPRPPPDRKAAPIPPPRPQHGTRQRARDECRGSLVAPGEDRRPVSRAVPRRACGHGWSSEPTSEAGLAVEVELDEGVAELPARPSPRGGPWRGARRVGVAKVGDVMSADPLVVAPEDTLGEVAEKMRGRDVGSALVAEYGRLIGILTSRDMLSVLAGRVHSSEARVRQWMTAEPIAVSVETTLDAAAILMTEHDIHHLPVVDGDRPVGMVGTRDVVRSAATFGQNRARLLRRRTSSPQLPPRTRRHEAT